MILSIALVTIGLYEVIGQNFIFKHKLYFANDVDHRLKPGSKADINSDGIRSMVEASEFHEEDLNMIPLGDSFI